jgi:polysaccharide deacetylase 2 family uncharacterized protein YibQ
MWDDPVRPTLWRRRRGLISFWVLIIAGAAVGAAWLQYLGPAPVAVVALPSVPAPPATRAPPPPQAESGPPNIVVTAAVGTQSTLSFGAPIPAPVPSLLAASAINPQWKIPQIGPNGATPMQTYAASPLPPQDAAMPPPNGARVAVLIAGLGDDLALAQVAAALPPQISLGLSPYGKTVSEAATAARAGGHEMLLLLPMPGLLASAPSPQNQATLDWSMAQIQGYAGVTDAFGPAMGGGFMANQGAKDWLLGNIAKRGLFYLEGDPNAGAAPFAAGRNADIVIDAASGPAEENAKLAALVTDAESQHAAIAIMLNPTPDALRTLAGWSDTLVNENIQLVPVSALVLPPEASGKP